MERPTGSIPPIAAARPAAQIRVAVTHSTKGGAGVESKAAGRCTTTKLVLISHPIWDSSWMRRRLLRSHLLLVSLGSAGNCDCACLCALPQFRSSGSSSFPAALWKKDKSTVKSTESNCWSNDTPEVSTHVLFWTVFVLSLQVLS